jgi:hypothetical protein
MAAISTSRRADAGIALIVAGVIFVLVALLPLLKLTFTFVSLAALGAVALVVAFAILSIGAVNSTVSKISLIVAAVGWAIIALEGFGVFSLPGDANTIVVLVTAAAGVVAAIVLYTGKEIRNRPAIIFIVATALAALYLLPVSLGTLGTLVVILFGVALIAAGWLFRQTERSRR